MAQQAQENAVGIMGLLNQGQGNKSPNSAGGRETAVRGGANQMAGNF
jgi:hypothetical protein